MTSRIRTLDFLPEIFKTKPNEQFLSATLDTLTQQPKVEKLQGFIGNKFGYGVNSKDSYINEPTKSRNNYQLEPAVIFKKKDTDVPLDLLTYSGLNDALRLAGSNLPEHSLYSNQFYSWDSFTDLDKLVNYSQYYWLPTGPDPVTVTNLKLSTTVSYTVTSLPLSYSLSAKSQLVGDYNPKLTLVRGGVYYFNVDQTTPFYIQTSPDISGKLTSNPSISTRDIFGLTNNGATTGTIKFVVPQLNEQSDWELTFGLNADLTTAMSLSDIEAKPVGSVSIDGVTDLEGKTILFRSNTPGTRANLVSLYDENDIGFDGTEFDPTTETQLNNQLYTVTYVGDNTNGFFINLVEADSLPINKLIKIQFGDEFNGRSFVKNAFGEILLVPPVTANTDTYYYVDGVNPDKYGEIEIVDSIDSSFVNVEQILGKKTYTSANGITFTNGLCVQFAGNTFPAEYTRGSYIVEGVGDSINLILLSELLVPEIFSYQVSSPFDAQYFDTYSFGETFLYPKDKDYITISRNAKNKNAWSRSNRWFHVDVLKATLEYNPDAVIVSEALGNPEKMAKRPIIEFYPNLRLMNSGVSSKNNVSYINFTESQALFTAAGTSDFVPDGSTSYLYDGATIIFAADADLAVRSTVYKIQVSETVNTEVISIISLSGSLTNADGSKDVTYQVSPQTKSLPANKLLSVYGNENASFNGTFRIVSTTATTITLRYPTGTSGTWDEISPTYLKTNLETTLTEDSTVNYLDQVAIISGSTYGGKTFYFDGSNWVLAQQKDRINQPPLFDLFDNNNHSLSDTNFYPASDFEGCTLFEYAIGSGVNDTELNFPIKYNSVENIGDIVFNNSLNTQKFHYVLGNDSIESSVSIGYAHISTFENEFTRHLGWQTAIEESFQYQVFNMQYTGIPFTPTFICDVPVKTTTAWTPIVVYVDNARIADTEYTVSVSGDMTTIKLVNYPVIGTMVDIMLLSDTPSKIGYYQTPINLDHNPYNSQIETLSLGDIRGHYKSMFNNAPSVTGTAFGPNNFRDSGNLIPYGTRIIQNSAPLTLPASFLRNNDYNFFEALTFNSIEYIKYKATMINALDNNDFSYITSDAALLDEVISIITEPKTETSPFFWSDMLPSKNITQSKTYSFKTVLDTSIFQLLKVYDYNNANYNSVLVYLTRKTGSVVSTKQLINGIDYIISAEVAELTVLTDLIPGDKIVINEYAQTFGNFVPNTPTKLGLYPSFVPELILDSSYLTPTYFIKGHDGSYSKLYGNVVNGYMTDARDRLVFEFESRIYNNLKVLNKTISLKREDIVPGYFRSNQTQVNSFNEAYETQLLNWVGLNRIDLNSQFYDATNEFTWNYRGSKFKLDKTSLSQGNWRGIYLWLYDTATPNATPWEMLGLSNKPSWWDTHYGAAPYTSDNLIMWTDIANGYVWNNGEPYTSENLKRPGLLEILPVDSAGKLISPFTSCVATYDANTFNTMWEPLDMGPAEYSYIKSSSWPFDMVRMMVLTKPAKFFNLNVDLDFYQYSSEFNQYLVGERMRTPPTGIKIYGTDETTSAHSYINWIVDYSTQFGVVGSDEIKSIFSNTDVRLVYKAAGFTSKDMIKFFTENSSSSSTKASLIPEDSYSVLLYNNQPTDTIIYSSIVVQKTLAGYKVYGNKQSKAYFTVRTPISGLYEPVTVNGKTVQIAKSYSQQQMNVPYGFEFNTIERLLEFVKGYGLYLESQGMIFDDIENSLELSWDQMLAEVLYWTQSGWEVGSTVSINPAANILRIDTGNALVQPLTLSKQNFVLNQNLLPIALNDLSIHRVGTELSIKALNSGDALSFFVGNVSSIEHVIVFDNTTIFGDLIFDIVTGLRQQRLFVKGTKTAEWNGTLDAAGFIMSLDSITDWIPNQKYSKGTVVKFKSEYWMANVSIVQPKNTFDYSEWLKTTYEMVQQRMLPNQSTRSAEAALYYNKNTANLANDADLLSFSLIGYRPRDYLDSADLDDSSQVNLFSNFIEGKGTNQTVSGLNGITLKDDSVNYTVHENWAIKTSEFGGVLNHNYLQFTLDESKLVGNPSVVSIIEADAVEGAQQQVSMHNLTNYGRTLASNNILPQVDPDSIDYLPSAGYVNLDDVIEIGYRINDFSDAAITGVYKNDYLWVANKNSTWDVYTPVSSGALVTSVVNNLNDTVAVIFDKPHALLEGQSLGILNFDSRIDGYHTVDSVTSLTSIVISITLSAAVTNINGSGLVFLLQSQRVSTPRDIPNLPLLNTEYDSTKVWVDQGKDGGWKVFEKTNNYELTDIEKEFPNSSTGTAVAYVHGVGYLTGDPATGELSVYDTINDDGRYYEKAKISKPNTTFGQVIEHNTDVILVAAPSDTTSQIFVYRNASSEGITRPVFEQVLSVSGGKAGTALAISGDSNYIYVNAIDTDAEGEALLMFSLDANLLKTGTGMTTVSDIALYSKTFVVSGDQRAAIQDGQRISFITSYSLISTISDTFNYLVTNAFDGTNSSFKLSGDKRSLLGNGDVVSFGNSGVDKNRLYNITLTGYDPTSNKTTFYVEQQPIFWEDPVFVPPVAGTNVYKVSFATDAVYTVATGAYNTQTQQTTFYITSEFNQSIASGAQVYVASMNYELVQLFNPSQSWVFGDEYAASIATNYDGSKIFVGAPKHDQSASQQSTGLMYAYDRLFQNFEIQRDQKPGAIYVVRLPWYPAISSKVYLNGKLLASNKYTLILNAIIFGPIGILAGDIIKVSSDNLVLTGTFVNGNPSDLRSGQMFGYALDCNREGSEIIVSAPYAVTSDNKEGAVYRFTDQGKRYGTWVGVTSAALVEPTQILLNGYRANLFNVFALKSTVTNDSAVGATSHSVFVNPAEAALMPPSGLIGFRKIVSGDTYNIAYRSVDATTGEIKFAYADANDTSSDYFNPQVYDSVQGAWVSTTVTLTTDDTQIYAPLGSARNIADAIVKANITNVFAYSTEDNRLVIRLRDMSLAPNMNKLSVGVFNGNYWTMLGMLPYPIAQTITPPHDVAQTMFGAALKFNEANSFVVGAPTAKRLLPTKFDFSNDKNVHNDTVFDNNLTGWEDSFDEAGAVYMYDYIDSYDESLDNIGKYIYSQPCTDLVSDYGVRPMFGFAVDFNNYNVVVGAPKFKTSTVGGKAVIFRNYAKEPNWKLFREADQVVDIHKINKVHLFNNVTDVTNMALDYIDPLQGKLLGVVIENLDHTSPVDPASYNSSASTSNKVSWNSAQLGKLWFDTSNVRFLNYHQNDVAYNSKYWGQVFPGSDVAVYTWIESSVPPASYTGNGTPFELESYSVTFTTDSTDTLVPKYYFWVRDTNILNTKYGKTLSDQIIARYIETPKESGVAFLAPLRANTFGLYNSYDYINNTSTNIHIGFSTTTNDVSGHSEFKLIRTDFTEDFLPGFVDIRKGFTEPTSLYEKYIDSFAGADSSGAVVPDPTLPLLMQTGISVRPRQSMFVNRLSALENYLTYINSVLINYPILETSHATFLYSATNEFDTTAYWDAVYWWAEGYSATTRANLEVSVYDDLYSVTAKENLIVGVSANAVGKREVYIYQSGTWNRIGLEQGTVQFSYKLWDYTANKVGFGNEFFDTSLFDAYPSNETRNIIRAINEQLLVGELFEYRNKSLTLMFEFIQSENVELHNYLPWLNKTRFADVSYDIRTLKQTPRYKVDNSQLLEGYINEVKPYSVVIKEFFAKYNVMDTVASTISDFDLPSYYDTELQKFVSPQVVFGSTASLDEKTTTDAIWNDFKYSNWKDNLGMLIKGGETRLVSFLKKYVSLTSTDLEVENAYTLPVEGILKINSEQIAYNRIDRVTGKLEGVTRGVNGTSTAVYLTGTPVYMDTPDVTVLDSGRDYEFPPTVTAYINTTEYPAPRREAVLEAVMNNDRMVGVNVIDPGEGYIVAPEIKISSSVEYVFDNFDSSQDGATNFVDRENSQLRTTVANVLETGDTVLVTNNSSSSVLIPNGYYYAQVVKNTYGTTITFFDTFLESFNSLNPIRFNTGVVTSGFSLTVGIAARAIANTDTSGVRNISTTLKFDRVSYTSRVKNWQPYKFWSSAYTSIGNDASSSVDSSTNTMLSSLQGVVLPIQYLDPTEEFAVVTVDYSYSNILPGQVNESMLQFYKVTGSYTPEIVDGTNGRAHIEIYRPKFSNGQLSEVYTIKILDAGSIYANGDTIRIQGSDLGGEDGTNDATILVKFANKDTGAIQVASISGRASGIFAKYYVKAIDNTRLQIYSNPTYTRKVPRASFVWGGELNATQSFGAVGNDYAFMPEPIDDDFSDSHDSVSLVSYAGVIWACTQSNADAEFNPAKWQPLTTTDLSLTALERIDGFYQPGVGMVPKDHQQLLKGITYPNPVYLGNKFAPDEALPIDVVLNDNQFIKSTSNIKGVVFNGETYVAVAETENSITVLVRNENLTWDPVPLSSERKTVTGISYSNEMYVITVDDDVCPMYVSFDSKKWISTSKQTSFDSLDYDDGLFDTSSITIESLGLLAVNRVGNRFFVNNTAISTSEDGMIWKKVHTLGNRKYSIIKDIAYAELSGFTGYIAVGEGYIVTSGANTPAPVVELSSKILISADGSTWEEVLPVTSAFIPVAVATNDDVIVIVCRDGKIFTSASPTSWAESVILGDDVTENLIDVAFGNNMFVAIGEVNADGNSVILMSSDGLTWTQQTNELIATTALHHVYFDGSNFIISGDLGTLIQSTNGVNWENILVVRSEDPVYTVKGSDFLFGYGPEELVAGVISDKLSMKVNTAPGAYWNRSGAEEIWYYASGFGMNQQYYTVDGQQTVNFDGLAANGIGMSVFLANVDGTMQRLYEDRTYPNMDYTYNVNWNSKVITFNDVDLIGASVFVEVYEFGNAVEKARSSTDAQPLVLDSSTGHSSIYTGLDYVASPVDPVIFAYTPTTGMKQLVLGEDFNIAIEDGKLKLALTEAYNQETDYVVYTIPRTGKNPDNVDEHYVSFPETQFFVSGGSDFVIDLDVSLHNIPNAIVELNGSRLVYETDYVIEFVIDEVTNTYSTKPVLTLAGDATAPGTLLAVTMFNGTSRQYLTTASEVLDTDASEFIVSLPAPSVPFPMAPMTYTNGKRMWVTVNGNRIDPTLVSVTGTTATILHPVEAGDIVVATAMVSSASPNESSFRFEMDKNSNMKVYRTNAEDTSWLTEDINPTDEIISVRDARYLVSLHSTISVVQETINGELFAYLNATFPDISKVTVYDTTLAESVPQANVLTKLVNGIPAVVFTDFVQVGDNLELTVYQGDVLEINGEKIHFTDIDLDTNVISGITRGAYGTQVAIQHPKYSRVFSLSQGKMMDPSLYRRTWTDTTIYQTHTWDVPLQLSNNPAANFLKLNNI